MSLLSILLPVVFALCVEAQRSVSGRSRGRRIAGGIIAGIVVAIVVGLLLCCLLVCLCVRRRRRSRAGSTGAPMQGASGGRMGGGFMPFGRKGRNAGVQPQMQPMNQAGNGVFHNNNQGYDAPVGAPPAAHVAGNNDQNFVGGFRA